MASKEAKEYVFPEEDKIERNKYLESLGERERIEFNIKSQENARALRYSLEDIRQVKLDAFDAGANSVIDELIKYLTEYPLPTIDVDKILAKLKEINNGK